MKNPIKSSISTQKLLKILENSNTVVNLSEIEEKKELFIFEKFETTTKEKKCAEVIISKYCEITFLDDRIFNTETDYFDDILEAMFENMNITTIKTY